MLTLHKGWTLSDVGGCIVFRRCCKADNKFRFVVTLPPSPCSIGRLLTVSVTEDFVDLSTQKDMERKSSQLLSNLRLKMTRSLPHHTKNRPGMRTTMVTAATGGGHGCATAAGTQDDSDQANEDEDGNKEDDIQKVRKENPNGIQRYFLVRNFRAPSPFDTRVQAMTDTTNLCETQWTSTKTRRATTLWQST